MTQKPESQPPARVRVTGPARRRSVARRPGTDDIDAGTRVGAILLESLLGAQLRLAVGVLTVLVLTLGSLPLVFHLLPDLAAVRVVGIPLAYLLLWLLVHPLLIALGWVYVRRAETHEQNFVSLLAELDDPLEGRDGRGH